MSKISKLFLLVLLTVAVTVNAATITEGQARQIAVKFLNGRAIPSAGLKVAHKAPGMRAPQASDQAAYYVFSTTAGQRGSYVIVAGDDRAPAVLAYSDHGTFDSQNVPEAMQELLDSYAEQIEALRNGAEVSPHLATGNAIAPLVTASWSQNSPYNTQFPVLSHGGHAVVGCVATALAQVLHYWKHPAHTTAAIPGYTSTDLSIYMPSLPITSFEWDAMQDSYLQSDSLSAAAQAAAKLSLYCSQSVEMNFGLYSSGAYTYDIPAAIEKYFDYKSSATYYQREYFTTQQWESMILTELAANRPVIYSGSKMTGGHAFVCDGYDGNGLFHINWGWNGSSNGYFLLNVLNPSSQGTGGISGTYGYIMEQGIIIGIEPGEATANDLQVTARQFSVESYSSSRGATSLDFTARVTVQFFNAMQEEISFDYGWALYQGNTLVKVLSQDYYNHLWPRYYIHPTVSLSFGSGITSGSYRLVGVYRMRNGASPWQPCIGSDVNYAQVDINGNNCTVTAYGSSNTPNYRVNSVDMSGHMHPNRPVYIDVNMTNNGYTRNDLLYMFANGTLVSEGYIDIDKGSRGNVSFEYMTGSAGTYTISFSLKEDGSNPLATRTLTIDAMPTASLYGTGSVLNVTDAANHIITSDKYSVVLDIMNIGSNAYDEDITIKLYKHIYGNYGTTVQTLTKAVQIQPNQIKTVRFDFDNVVDGWSYFTKAVYYSAGQERSLTSTGFHTIVFPGGNYNRCDVNGDGEVNIMDVDVVISIILGKSVSVEERQRADVNQDAEINIRDVDMIIQTVLTGH